MLNKKAPNFFERGSLDILMKIGLAPAEFYFIHYQPVTVIGILEGTRRNDSAADCRRTELLCIYQRASDIHHGIVL